MTQQRQYEPATVFNARITDMRHLWTPSTEFEGKKQDKPSWFAGFIVPKTQASWHLEPALAGVTQAFTKLHQNAPHIGTWPIVDGDMPNPKTGKQSEFAKGHWMFGASTQSPPNEGLTIELVQAGGALTKLMNKTGVKSGDYCMVGLTAAISKNDARKVKFYLNAVVFTAPGEEIVFANSVSGAELMRAAEAQGFRPTGFSGSPGFAGAPQGGFPGAGAGFQNGPMQHGFQQPQGFQPGFPGTPQQPAQQPAFAPQMAPAFGAAPAPGGMPNAAGGNATSPFSQPFGGQPGPFPPR